MENLNPALVLLWDVLRSIETGNSVNQGVVTYLNRREGFGKKNEFQYQLETWWAQSARPRQLFCSTGDVKWSPARRQLLHLIELGLAGESILWALRDLESEIISNCEEEISRFTALLPLKTMVPVMLCIFPSTLCLLLIPLLRMLEF